LFPEQSFVIRNRVLLSGIELCFLGKVLFSRAEFCFKSRAQANHKHLNPGICHDDLSAGGSRDGGQILELALSGSARSDRPEKLSSRIEQEDGSDAVVGDLHAGVNFTKPGKVCKRLNIYKCTDVYLLLLSSMYIFNSTGLI
jgi:hypothetical protein